MRTLLSRVAALFRRAQLDTRLDDEVRAHLDMLAADYEHRGMAPGDARRAARQAFGGVESMKERYRDRRGVPWAEDLRSDLHHSLRALGRAPVFALSAVLTLAVGMSAISGMFTVVNAVMLRPLVADRPEQLVSISHRTGFPTGMSFRDLDEYRQERSVLADAIGYAPRAASLNAGDGAERVTIEIVTDNYFSMLGVEPAAGRLIAPGEGRAHGDAAVLVLDYRYWQTRFAGDRSVVGRAVRMNGRPYTIIGVAPEQFRGTEALVGVAVYTSVWMIDDLLERAASSSILDDRAARPFTVLGRLQEGVSLEQARAALERRAAALARQYPETHENVSLAVVPESHARPNPTIGPFLRIASLALAGLAAVVLLITSANVANLLMVRASSRGREVAVRAALGARRGRLVRQFLTEGITLALLGGAVAVPVVMLAMRALHALVAGVTARATLDPDLTLDGRVVVVTLAVAVGAGIVAAIAPALLACRGNPDALSGGRGQVGAAGRRFRDVLVVAQVALSLALLVCGGLFVRSLDRAREVDLGFEPEGLLLASAEPGLQGYDAVRRPVFYDMVRARVAALPDVRGAAWISLPPLGVITERTEIAPDDRPADPDWRPPAVFSADVSAEYFQTAGIPLLAGRAFDREDRSGGRGVAIVDETVARWFWPDRSAIGRRVVVESTSLEVVGVVGSGKYTTISEAPRGAVFRPIAQVAPRFATLTVRTARPPSEMRRSVEQTIRDVDPEVAVYDVRSMTEHLDKGTAFFVFRLGAFITSVFGGLGVLLASIGLYGTIAFHVSRRTQEIGLRMALGARAAHVLSDVLIQASRLALPGVIVGLGLAYVVARLLQPLLVGVGSFDALTYCVVALSLVATCLLAAFVPAWRATTVNPMTALRSE